MSIDSDPTGSDLDKLTAPQARVIGVLVEKELTTPDAYPMTLKALTNACNQTTSRFPVVDYSENLVETTLHALKAKKLVRFVHPSRGERVTKYRQVIDEVLTLDRQERAVVALLLLRGAQSAAEIKTRSERMQSFGNATEVDDTLGRLADRSPAITARTGRQAGQKGERWIQLLEANAEERAGSAQPTAQRANSAGTREELDQLRSRVEALESQVATLMDALGYEEGS